MDDTNNIKLLRYIGLARRAGALCFGFDAISRAIRTSKTALVLLSSDAAANTVKQYADSCAFYKKTLLHLRIDMDTLAHAVGSQSPVAAVCVTDAGLAAAITKEIENGKLKMEN